MARTTYIQDPVTLKLIPKDEYQPRTQAGFFVIGDIQPYKSMVTGEMIQGRRQHREHLRQHGCIEVGNEKLPMRRPQPKTDDIKRDLYQVMNSKGY